MVNTFLAPTGEDSFLWYTARLPASGTLLRAKMHAHNTVFDESFLYLGTPQDVGLEDLRPKGRAFDVVAPPGPHVDFIPAYLPGHLHWILLTDDGTDGSAYWTIACFQDAAISQPASSTPLTRANTLQMQAGLWAMHLNGGAFTVAEFARTVALGLAGAAAAFLGPVALAVSCAKRKRS
ncbi:hypothetical protein JL721_12290 [Aureococcus anophagefferens]|nr:hypothetical protein JL721_12290 [Aureococcus anophagefferens]